MDEALELIREESNANVDDIIKHIGDMVALKQARIGNMECMVEDLQQGLQSVNLLVMQIQEQGALLQDLQFTITTLYQYLDMHGGREKATKFLNEQREKFNVKQAKERKRQMEQALKDRNISTPLDGGIITDPSQG